jgi:hypothetical protein
MPLPGLTLARNVFATPYAPDPGFRGFLARGVTQADPAAAVTVAVPDAAEAARLCGVPLARHGLQAVFVRVENRGDAPLRLQVVGIDPNYFTPLEAAGVCHHSVLRWLSAFGLLSWLLLPLVALLAPWKAVTAVRANRRIDDCFRALAFRLRPIDPGGAAEGFVFTRLDVGTKEVHVGLHALGRPAGDPTAALTGPAARPEARPAAAFTFSVPVPGIAADYRRRDFAALVPADAVEEFDAVAPLAARLAGLPAATTNRRGSAAGDPVNLVVVGGFEAVIAAFAARWDETETITLGTCWKTARSFLLGAEYRYSPVSPLYLFGRAQDVALQRSRRSIDERLHLRLWLTPLRFLGRPVWVGQVSRDIGVRFTTRAWNLTTHRIDPDVDEARDYVVEDLLAAERAEAAGYVGGAPACGPAAPRRNLTGDPYFTDGRRAVVLVSAARTAPRFVAWL